MRRGQVELTLLFVVGLIILIIFYYLLTNSYVSSLTPPSFSIKPIKFKVCKHEYAKYEVIIKNPNDVDIKVTLSIDSISDVQVYIDGELCTNCVKEITVPARGQVVVEVWIASKSIGRIDVEGVLAMNGQLVGKFVLPAFFVEC